MEARGQIGQIARACRTVSLTSESHHRLGRITGQILPGPIHPDQLERGVEPEDRLAPAARADPARMGQRVKAAWNQRSIQ